MVQQTKDSIVTQYRLAHDESDSTNSDKQLSVPGAAKKSKLLNFHSENSIAVSKSVGSPFLMKDSEVSGEEVQICGTKRPILECLRDPPKINTGSGHIVYVRRKTEIDLVKSNNRAIQSHAIVCPKLKKSTDVETPQQLEKMIEPVICVSDAALLKRTSSPVFSQDSIKVNVMLWDERYCRLQSLLKILDQSDQYEFVQMLRSLSSVELSRHAIELEKRSIKLSLEEAREMQRCRFIDVLSKYGKNVCTPSSNQQEQLH